MVITYRDITFCINQNCKKRCNRFLTPQIEQKAQEYGLPLAVAELICLDCGDDGVYEYKDIEQNEEMS